jgi:hypothetical protein
MHGGMQRGGTVAEFLARAEGSIRMGPPCCPICESISLNPIKRSLLVTSPLDGLNLQEPVAYRCENGHVFIVGNAAERAAAQGSSE